VGAQFSWRALRAKALAHHGSLDEAEALAREAVERARTTDTIAQRASVLLAYAEVLRLSGRTSAAAEAIDDACVLLESKGSLAASRNARAKLRELSRA
jgi:ATP/maltotriose-dependent transcriptional regulator MalT